MGNFLTGESTRLIAFGGSEAAGFFKLSFVVALVNHPLPGEAGYA
jgi:hypothetical protein